MPQLPIEFPIPARGGLVGRLKRIWVNIDLQSMAVLMLVATLVGVGTSLTAVIFIKAIEWITQFSFNEGLPQLLSFLGPYWIIVVPVMGGLITGPIIYYFALEAKGHGVPEVKKAIITNGGRIRPQVAGVKAVASAVCIGTGGSAGREGPIVQIGAALGSTLAQFLNLNKERTVTLVACGSAAGIAATFNAPIAGVIFAMEVILDEFTTHYFGTVVVAAVAASVVSRYALGNHPAFAVPTYILVSPWELLFYALLGVLAAVVGWSFVGALDYAESKFDSWRFPNALKPAVGAVGVGLIGFVLPQALGTGLVPIEQTLSGNTTWSLLLALLVAKFLATTFTLGSGNSGGVFSPSLYMGAMLGGLFGYLVHLFFPDITAGSGAYALVGMASVFSAAAHAPLTASLIVFEMSQDYRMILPLMVTVGLSTLLSQYLRRYSIYTIRLHKTGVPIERDRDVDLMKSIRVCEVMTQKPETVRANTRLANLADLFVRTRHHGFPVVDDHNELLGVVTVQDLERTATAGAEIDQLSVADITVRDIVVVFPDDSLAEALEIMGDGDYGRLPVVERQNPTQLVGLLRRADIVRAYRHAVLHKMENQHRAENIRLGQMTKMEILEIELSPDMTGVGQYIRNLKLPSDTLITSIRRRERIIIAHGDTQLQAGDVVVALTRQGTAPDVRRTLARPLKQAQ
jgi:CIC family chloride channel protein